MSSSSEEEKCKPKQSSGDTGSDKISDDGVEDPDVYTVERIVDCRFIDGVKKYEIKWKNYPSSENTWEPEDNIIDKTVIEAYNKSRQRAKQQRKMMLEDMQKQRSRELKESQMRKKHEKSKKISSRLAFISSESSSESDVDDSKKMPPPPSTSHGKGGSSSPKKDKYGQKSDGAGKSLGKGLTTMPRKKRSDFGTTRKPKTTGESSLDKLKASGRTDWAVKVEKAKKPSPKPEPRNFTDVGLGGILGERQLIDHKKKAKDKMKKDKALNKSAEAKMSLSMDDYKYTKEKSLLAQGYEVDFVIGVQVNDEGHLFYLVMYKPKFEKEEEQVEYLLNEVLADEAPMTVIAYFERILKFIPVTASTAGYQVVPDSGSESDAGESDCSKGSRKSAGSYVDASTESMTDEDDMGNGNTDDVFPPLELDTSD